MGDGESGSRPAAFEGAERIPTGLGRMRDFLIARPELVLGDEGLMRALGVRPAASNVVEFGPAALGRLEAAWTRESSARQQIEQVARANFAAQAQAHAVILDLLEARNNADLARRVDLAATRSFGLAAGALLVEAAPAPAGWGVCPLGSVDQLLGRSGERMGPAFDIEALFGPETEGVQSMALVRLSLWTGRAGLLAFGSADPDGFRRDMGAELVLFLARVVERAADRWPPLA